MRRERRAGGPRWNPEDFSMKMTLWIAQGVLALAFLAAGAMRLAMPIADLHDALAWTADVPSVLVRLIGLAEVLGALGLVLPAATRVRPRLTALAAAALALDMAVATLFHLVRGEASAVPATLILGAGLAFVAWGRAVRLPVAPPAAAARTPTRMAA
jgi:putative oxidoreductase